MVVVSRARVLVVIAALAGGCAGDRPDLVPVDVAGSRTTDGTTTTIVVAYGIRNDGDATVIDPPGPDNSAETRYYLETSDGSRTYDLSSARVTPPGTGDTDLVPGMTLWHADPLMAGPGSEPTADLTRVCVEVDGPNAVAESDESNNVTCAPFPGAGQADLIMSRADEIGPNLVTVELDLAMRNVGTAYAPAGLLVRAVWQSPTGPQDIGLFDCPITAEQRREGMSGGCGSITNLLPIAPGAAHTQRGYLMFPEGVATGSTQTVDITADACTAASGLPAYCAVDERHESNNTMRITVTAP